MMEERIEGMPCEVTDFATLPETSNNSSQLTNVIRGRGLSYHFGKELIEAPRDNFM